MNIAEESALKFMCRYLSFLYQWYQTTLILLRITSVWIGDSEGARSDYVALVVVDSFRFVLKIIEFY